MISYKGKSFCSERHCKNTSCDRNYTQEIDAAAQRWWNKGLPPGKHTGAPISVMNLRTETCGYIKK